MRKKDNNTFLLISLEEDKAKKLANVISSDVCRKILDFLAAKDATETEMSSALGVPLSTVHYNMQQLVQAGLVKVDEFHYSPKGKEVNHYSLANKYIIIAPKNSEGLTSKLKRLLVVFAVMSGVGIAIQLLSKMNSEQAQIEPMMMQKGLDISQRAAESGATAPIAEVINYESAIQISDHATSPALGVGPNIAFWFMAGAFLALLAFLAYDVLRERFK